MSGPLTSTSCLTQLQNFYDKNKEKIETPAENLFLKLTKGGLKLEERGGWTGWKRLVVDGLRRLWSGESQYNFVKNLTEFQKLICGAIGELEGKEVEPETVEKVTKLAGFYNKLLESRRAGGQSARLDKYIQRLQKPETKPGLITSDKVLESIHGSLKDPVLCFLAANFNTLVSQTTDEKERLSFLCGLLTKKSADYAPLSKAYEKLKGRVEKLSPFKLEEEAFKKAQNVFRDSVVSEQDFSKEATTGAEKLKTYLESLYNKLEDPKTELFLSLQKQAEGLYKKLEDLNEKVKDINQKAKKEEFSETYVSSLDQEKIRNAWFLKLMPEPSEEEFSKIEGQIDSIATAIDEEDKKLDAFSTRLESFVAKKEEVQKDRQQLVASLDQWKERGPLSAIVADTWKKKIEEEFTKCKKEEDFKNLLQIMKQQYTHEQFIDEVKKRSQQQQASFQSELQEIQNLLPSADSKGFLKGIGQRLTGWIFSIMPGAKSASIEEAAAQGKQEGLQTYAINRLHVQAQKIVAWYNYLSQIASESKAVLSQDGGEIAKEIQDLLDGEMDPKKLLALLDKVKQLSILADNLQVSLENGSVPCTSLLPMKKALDLIVGFQLLLYVVDPLFDQNPNTIDTEALNLVDYIKTCKDWWNRYREKDGDQFCFGSPDKERAFEDEMKQNRDLLERLVELTYLKWNKSDGFKKSFDDFKALNDQSKSEYIGEIEGKLNVPKDTP